MVVGGAVVSGNGDRTGPNGTAEAAVVAGILHFCRQHAVPHTDLDSDQDHERELWQAIRVRFGKQWAGDFDGLLDDYLLAIRTAMFTE